MQGTARSDMRTRRGTQPRAVGSWTSGCIPAEQSDHSCGGVRARVHHDGAADCASFGRVRGCSAYVRGGGPALRMSHLIPGGVNSRPLLRLTKELESVEETAGCSADRGCTVGREACADRSG